MSTTLHRRTLIAVAVAALAGCASTTPNVDAHFGEAVRTARAQQTINPDGPRNRDPVAGLDGRAAKSAMERYQESFKTPPPTFDVINIGGGIGGGNGK